MNLTLLEERYCVCLLDPADPIPAWLQGHGILSSTYSDSELSIVCPESRVPKNVLQEPDWCALQVQGPLAFEQIGILHSLLEPLARALVPVFVLSTYQTDYLFIKAHDYPHASQALQEAGHQIHAER